MGGCDRLGAVAAGHVIGLANQVDEAVDVGREPLDVAGPAQRRLQHLGHGTRLQGPEAGALAERRHVLGELRDRVGVGLDVVVEVGHDLEELGELGIGLREEIEEPAVAEQDHLDVERHRLGLESLRHQHAHGRQRRFDAQLARLERALQTLVGKRPAQQLQDVEIEESTICPMQRPWPDHQEIGDQRALLGPLLDPPQEPLEVGLVLEHDGCLPLVLPVHQKVDAVAAKRWRQFLDRCRVRRLLLRLGIAEEDADMAAHVGFQPI